MSKTVISHISSISIPKKGTILLLVDDEGQCAEVAKEMVGDAVFKRIKKAYSFKGRRFTSVDSLSGDDQTFDRIVLLGLGKFQQLSGDDWLKLGGAAYNALKNSENASIILAYEGFEITQKQQSDFMIGLELASYKFDKYLTVKKEDNEPKKEPKISILCIDKDNAERAYKIADAVANGVILARNLVNEPANYLGPEEFVHEVEKLKKHDVKVEILDEKDLRKLGMNALLGVAQGSKKPARVAVMRWNGGETKDKPIAFVGKGVVFDSGGISLKPGAGMEDMKGDMGGAAAVTGLMKVLALTEAKVNAVGVIGIVENMPDGGAQRPGDIVTSMSGQTIEVINTDAEGRLVLADILWYTKQEFKPKFMIDLATLTGAILVALGQSYAGLFSNNDRLAQHLVDAGETSGEKVWRLPLAPEYDKIVDSKFADMRNSCGRNAGSITAAQFLQRFVGDTPWAHLDIAGTAMDSVKNEYNQSWASGFGVRLLHQLVESDHEV